MKVKSLKHLAAAGREIHCPKGGFVSSRFLLESDGMGFTMTHTFIPKGMPQTWHYKNHLEACYCVSGEAKLASMETGETFMILPGDMYALDRHDKHLFMALEDTVLICVFNPPLKGAEVHGEDGSYE